MTISVEKVCSSKTGCGSLKSIDDFYQRRNGSRKQPCKECWRKKQLASQKTEAFKKRRAIREMRTTHGVDIEKFREMELSQHGVCKICNNPCDSLPRLSIDHCHTTGKVRGLLCRKCNCGLGYFKDNAQLLRAAISYLESSQ